MSDVLVGAVFLAALGSGLMAGFFYGFSGVVMKALGRVAPPAGIAAMQSINVVVLNPLFFLIFFGTALLSLGLAVAPLMEAAGQGSGLAAAGGATYLVTNIGVTVVRNVPMNDRLASTDPASSAGAAYWAEYLRQWTRWNHARTIGAVGATALFIAALIAGA